MRWFLVTYLHPILRLHEGNCQIAFPKEHANAISPIYYMIFKAGIDEPTQVPIDIIDDCMYKITDTAKWVKICYWMF